MQWRAPTMILTWILALSHQPDWVTIRACVTLIKKDKEPWYWAKKAEQRTENSFRYEKCDREDPEAERRFLLNIAVEDHTGHQWFTLFDESQVIFQNFTVDELGRLKDTDVARYEEIIDDCMFHDFVFRINIKTDTRSEERRLKCTVHQLQPVDFVAESKYMISEIKKRLS